MTFKEYVTNLTQLLIEYPELAEKKTVYAKDDEGNGYREVYFIKKNFPHNKIEKKNNEYVVYL